jgi:sodium pump decarboxylase gamma subunit
LPDSFVVVLGVGTVFFGLICLVLLCKIIGLFCGAAAKKEASAVATTPAPAVNTAQPIENRQEIIAAVSAVIAEELGTDINALRIISFKKI